MGFTGLTAFILWLFFQGKSIEENIDAWKTMVKRVTVTLLVSQIQLHQIDKYRTGALSGQRGAIPVGRKYKIIAFDLDGTLLRGLDYSWSAVWEELGRNRNYRSQAMLMYMRNEISYQEWCERDYEEFHRESLSESSFAKIAGRITVTNYLREAVMDLRANGLIVAIISGGIDALLKVTIPDANQLFDYICINRMHFGSDQVISGIEPTPFDYEKKAVALAAICRKHGCTLKESVFVGEGPNDSQAARVAGLSIAYPPKPGGLISLTGISIEDDDLRKILPYVYELPQIPTTKD